jgi:hypothetical protein
VSITYIRQYLKKHSEDFTGWDSLASSYQHIGEDKKAATAGNNSLILKDRKYGILDNKWQPSKHITSELTVDKKKVISFSLWGNEKRYIFGSLRNLLLAPDLYRGWELWCHVDNSVSQGFIELIKQLGGKVLLQPKGHPQQHKLC